jgi:hypothetical protein
MLKNIPVKFTQKTMLELIEPKFGGTFDYFYLPMDLKTQGSVGFAFINFVHPASIMRFYSEFQDAQWAELVDSCKSTKKCAIVYANVQGLEEIKAELRGKEIMKKREQAVRPYFVEAQPSDVSAIVRSEIAAA